MKLDEVSQDDFIKVSNRLVRSLTRGKTISSQPKAILLGGQSGAGKTTIVNLLMRFYEVDRRMISIDGVNSHDMTRKEVHDAFAMVLQDTWLFEGTVKENLIYNQKHITDEQVIAAAKAVGVHHFIKT